MKRRQTQWLARGAAIAALVTVAAAALYWHGRPTEVQIVRPIRDTAVQAVYATGTVEPTVSIPIAPRMGGIVTMLGVDEGDRIKAGEVLARLDDRDLRQTVAELEAREDLARRAFERTRTLAERGVASQSELDRARAEWEAAQAATARAREQLAFMTLRAPADGYVLRRDGEIGEYTAVNQPLFFLATEAPLRVAAEVDEEDIALVEPGQSVLIGADAFPEQVFDGDVTEVTPMGDPVSRSYRVRIGFARETPLLVGMTAEVNIIVDKHEDALLVPNSAVVEGNDIWAVWTLQDGRLAKQPVTVGIVGEQKTEITAGLDEDARVIAIPRLEFEVGQRAVAVESP